MMPRTCLACSSPSRLAIDTAIASGEPLRDVSAHVSISPSALARHKAHVAGAIVKASERREQNLGESILRRLETLYGRTEKILNTAESAGDHRLVLQAVREARENLAGIFALANKASEVGGLSGVTNGELEAEVKRRGLDTLFHVVIEHIGSGRKELP
jgi:hypothetical protein